MLFLSAWIDENHLRFLFGERTVRKWSVFMRSLNVFEFVQVQLFVPSLCPIMKIFRRLLILNQSKRTQLLLWILLAPPWRYSFGRRSFLPGHLNRWRIALKLFLRGIEFDLFVWSWLIRILSLRLRSVYFSTYFILVAVYVTFSRYSFVVALIDAGQKMPECTGLSFWYEIFKLEQQRGIEVNMFAESGE